MVETARSLEGVAGKVIVLVGSLSPARFKGSDAEFNIGFALGALVSLPEGVYIAMNGTVFVAGNVRKNRSENRFEAVSGRRASEESG
jgi:L-asparaginase